MMVLKLLCRSLGGALLKRSYSREDIFIYGEGTEMTKTHAKAIDS